MPFDNVLLDVLLAVVTLVAVVALILVFPFLMMWFFRLISIGTPKEHLNTIRKVR